MRRILIRAIYGLGLLLAGLALNAGPAGAEPHEARPFHWTGVLKAGQKLNVHGINGVIHAERSIGTEVVVDAEKHGRHDDPDRVRSGRARGGWRHDLRPLSALVGKRPHGL